MVLLLSSDEEDEEEGGEEDEEDEQQQQEAEPSEVGLSQLQLSCPQAPHVKVSLSGIL